MSGFSADWLHLREPFDHQARQASHDSFDLASKAKRWRAARGEPILPVLDLACGSASNLRALAPRLGGAQRWRLIDHDPALLAAVPEALAAWAHQHGHRFHENEKDDAPPRSIDIIGADFSIEVTLEQVDLACDLPSLDFTQAALVTGSALLDLVSETWLASLVKQARQARAALLFALNVDGHTTWTPTDPQDHAVHEWFGLHQLRDKGFGVALGGKAVSHALRLMRDAGYAVTSAQTDWIIRGTSSSAESVGNTPAMLAAMIDGMAAAALEQVRFSPHAPQHDNDDVATIHAWQARRLNQLPSTQLQVGHVDILATLH